MFSDFPSLHPLIVHFPIVLILISVAFQAAVVWRSWQQIRWATLLIMGAAFFAALAATTVFHAMPSDDAPKEAMEIFASHEKFASYTLWMSGVTFLLRCIGEFFKIFRRSYEGIVLAAALASAVFLSIAGHHGARLTHVAGVGPMGRYLMKEHDGSGGMKNMDHDKASKGDTTMQMNDAKPGMKNMPGMDTMKTMDDMKGMPGMEKKNEKKTKDMSKMENMKGMDNMQDKKNMTGMEKTKSKDDMKDMPGMDKKDDKKTKDMSKMENMNGMDDKQDKKNMTGMKNMDDMKDMPGMDKKDDSKTMDMSGMGKMKNMKDMNMPGMNEQAMNANPLDTFKFEDNNPAFQKSKKKIKQ